jgi:hypothetical protein
MRLSFDRKRHVRTTERLTSTKETHFVETQSLRSTSIDDEASSSDQGEAFVDDDDTLARQEQNIIGFSSKALLLLAAWDDLLLLEIGWRAPERAEK